MHSMGRKATKSTAGAAQAALAVTSPRADARLEAGAAEETPMTTLERRLTASRLRPFASTDDTAAGASFSVGSRCCMLPFLGARRLRPSSILCLRRVEVA
jgi:hypothetical protein